MEEDHLGSEGRCRHVSVYGADVKLSQILDQVDSGDIALPEFQRGYVWNRDQVRGLFTSLYRGYPIGGFLTWNTRAESAVGRGGPIVVDGTVKLLLDGQQRVTSLYGVIRGKAPRFFEGDRKTFTGLYFNLDDETFEFYAPVKMKDNPAWIDVTDLMQPGAIGQYISRVNGAAGGDMGLFTTYVTRLNAVAQIPSIDVHVDEVTGEDKTVDVVVDIFNRVNSGGTKLSKGDLALAKVCASWPEARAEMNDALQTWDRAGFHFKLELLLRTVNALVTGEALFSALADIETARIHEGLTKSRKYIGYLLDLVSGRLGLDHDRVLLSHYAFPLMSRYVDMQGGHVTKAAESDKLLYWYIHAGMWGRYAGSTETVLNQDLKAIESGGLDALIANIAQMRGDLRVRQGDFAGYSLGARFYKILYMLTRTLGARDFGTGIPLSAQMLGHLTSLQVHHIFPKARLYEAGYQRADVNAVANFCFLTQDTNLVIGAQRPEEYFERVEQDQPGALASQWIPMDRDLWKIDRYLDFLEARRELLASATNGFLDTLREGKGQQPILHTVETRGPVTVVALEEDVRDAEVTDLIAWLQDRGYGTPERDVEVLHPDNRAVLAVAEAYWPDGLQEGIGNPVVLELDPESADEDALEALGMHVFTTIDGLREYVMRQSEMVAVGS